MDFKISCIQFLITNVQNIYNLIGREVHNFGRIIPSVSILYSLTKTTTFKVRN